MYLIYSIIFNSINSAIIVVKNLFPKNDHLLSSLTIYVIQVLSRLANSVKPTIKLSELATQEQLHKLLYNATHSKFNNVMGSWGGQWVRHAVLCMLEDIVEGELNIHSVKLLCLGSYNTMTMHSGY